jgi:hypothetical protein
MNVAERINARRKALCHRVFLARQVGGNLPAAMRENPRGESLNRLTPTFSAYIPFPSPFQKAAS